MQGAAIRATGIEHLQPVAPNPSLQSRPLFYPIASSPRPPSLPLVQPPTPQSQNLPTLPVSVILNRPYTRHLQHRTATALTVPQTLKEGRQKIFQSLPRVYLASASGHPRPEQPPTPLAAFVSTIQQTPANTTTHHRKWVSQRAS